MNVLTVLTILMSLAALAVSLWVIKMNRETRKINADLGPSSWGRPTHDR